MGQSIKGEYKALTEHYIKFLSLRGVIVLTIILSLYGAIKSINDAEISSKVAQVNELCTNCTHRIPLSDNYMIDNIFFRDGLADRVADLPVVVPKDAADSMRIDSIYLVQEKLVGEIRATIKKKFQLRISALGDVTFDMEYWIFLLPIIFMITSAYIMLLDTKMRILKCMSDKYAPDDVPDIFDEKKIDAYSMFPFEFMRLLLTLLEIVMVVAFGFCFFGFLDRVSNDNAGAIVTGYVVMYYFCMVYAIGESNKLLAEMVDGPAIKPLVVRWWEKFLRFVARMVGKMPVKTSTIISTVLLLSTLFLVMSYNACRDKGEPEFYKGYELVLFSYNKVWMFAEKDLALSYCIQAVYTLCVLFALYFGFRYLFVKQRPEKKTGKFMILMPCLLYMFFTVYWGTFYLPKLWCAMVVFIVFTIVWLLTGSRHIRGKPQRQSDMFRNLFIIMLPFSLYTLYIMCFAAYKLQGWVALYFGLVFMVVSTYKYVKEEERNIL